MATPEPQDFPDQLDTVTAEGTAGTPAAFRPYIPAEVQLPEMTPLPLILGTVLGTIFGASSLYLVLKVGLTVFMFVVAFRFLPIAPLWMLGAYAATYAAYWLAMIGEDTGSPR